MLREKKTHYLSFSLGNGRKYSELAVSWSPVTESTAHGICPAWIQALMCHFLDLSSQAYLPIVLSLSFLSVQWANSGTHGAWGCLPSLEFGSFELNDYTPKVKDQSKDLTLL